MRSYACLRAAGISRTRAAVDWLSSLPGWAASQLVATTSMVLRDLNVVSSDQGRGAVSLISQ
jgi:hypothetical protein